MSGIHRFSEWIARLAYLNVLWFLFTLAGMIVFSLAPATLAACSLSKKWIEKEEFPVFTSFWQEYKASFIRANLIGWIVVAAGWFLVIDLRYFFHQQGLIFEILTFVTVFFLFIYSMVLFHVFPMLAADSLPVRQQLKKTLFITLSAPFWSLFLLVLTVGSIFLWMTIPGLIPFLSVGPLFYVFTWVTISKLKRVEGL